RDIIRAGGLTTATFFWTAARAPLTVKPCSHQLLERIGLHTCNDRRDGPPRPPPGRDHVSSVITASLPARPLPVRAVRAGPDPTTPQARGRRLLAHRRVAAAVARRTLCRLHHDAAGGR